MASVATEAPLSMPTAQMPVSGPDGIPTQPWWRFWYGLYVRNASTIPYLVGTALTAAGTTQANALDLAAEWNDLGTVAAGTGVKLKAFGTGFTSTVFNSGANTLKIYPPIGSTIDALGANNPFSLAAGKMQEFYQLTDTQFRSVKL